MNYSQMKKDYIQGWHTWNVRSVLSYVHMPDGLAFNLGFKEYVHGSYLKETLIGRFDTDKNELMENAMPGIHAFDERYTEIKVKWCGIEFVVESTVEGDDVIVLVTPHAFHIKPVMMTVETGYLWNRPGYTELIDGRIIAHSPTAGDTVIYANGKPTVDCNIPTQTQYLSVELTSPIVVCTGTNRTVEDVQQLILSRRKEVLLRTEKYGALAGLYQAMEYALAWDTIYDSKHDRVISPVSRLWSISNGGYVLFCWDNFFAGFMGSLCCKEIAYSNLREILNEHTKAGFVPNFAYATGQCSADRSQPPVGSTMLLETYRRYREKWIVEDMYPDLLKWNEWFAGNRSAPSGALCWGSNMIPILYGNCWEYEHHGVHGTYGAALESGLDNSPMYDDIPFNDPENRMELEDVGLTGLFIMDCKSLIRLAREIGCEGDIPSIEKRLARAEAGLEGMWDEENGFYYNRRTDTGKFSRRISPTNFYALFSDHVSDERARRIADEHYYNSEEFYGDWMLPSISRNDPAFFDNTYWRGRVWAPLNFLVYLALQNSNLADVRKDLASKSTKMFLKEWNEHRHVHENYNSVTGEGCDVDNSDKFYHWGALLTVIALAEQGYIENLGKPL